MMEFSFGILSETSPISYRRSHSPDFDADVETDQALVNSDNSAETVTVEVIWKGYGTEKNQRQQRSIHVEM